IVSAMSKAVEFSITNGGSFAGHVQDSATLNRRESFEGWCGLFQLIAKHDLSSLNQGTAMVENLTGWQSHSRARGTIRRFPSDIEFLRIIKFCLSAIRQGKACKLFDEPRNFPLPISCGA